MSSPTQQNVSVRNIISIFENQSISVNNEPTTLIRRAKSMGSLNYRTYKAEQEQVIFEKQVQVKSEKNLELVQIEQQIQHLQNTLSNTYKTYSKESHIYYQNQIVFTLTDVGNVETKGNSKTINKKSELTEALKRLNKKLNAFLPSSDSTTIVKTRPESVILKQKSFEAQKSRSFEEDRCVIQENKREVRSPKKEKVEQKKQEEEEDELDSAAVSVKTLKEMFEKNSTESEGRTEFGGTKITRKFFTFNGTSDFKYVPFNQRLNANTLDLDLNVRSASVKNDADSSSETLESYFSSRQVVPGSDEDEGEKRGTLSPDSLLSEKSGSSSSGGESDGEESGREKENGEEDDL